MWEAFSLCLLKHGEGDFFPKKAFPRWKNFEGQIYGEIVVHGGGLMIRSSKETVSQNAFPSNLNAAHLNLFPNHGKIFT